MAAIVPTMAMGSAILNLIEKISPILEKLFTVLGCNAENRVATLSFVDDARNIAQKLRDNAITLTEGTAELKKSAQTFVNQVSPSLLASAQKTVIELGQQLPQLVDQCIYKSAVTDLVTILHKILKQG